MSDPFIGQIIAVGFNFAPVGWALCDGSSIPISNNEALFTLIGTTYGGNGTTSFNLPDLRSRVAIGMGQGPGLSPYSLGAATGTESVTLTSAQIGIHTHALVAAADATTATPTTTTVLGTPTTQSIYGTSGATVALAGSSVGAASGGNTPHENCQPFQTVNYIIALQGIYPTQS